MLQLTDGRIIEGFTVNTGVANTGALVPFPDGNFTSGVHPDNASMTLTASGNCQTTVVGNSYVFGGCYDLPHSNYYQTVWMGYPVYVCSDKTAKAIEILKALQKEKHFTEVKSVPKFIELVEKIAAIL